jgi:ADP-ribosylation factor-like protein 2
VKRLNGEDISTISPTLGFNIKTMTFNKCAYARTAHALRLLQPQLTRGMLYCTACCRYTLNIWDVGGQKTLRAYWRNYYEATDGLVWVVDAADAARLPDCAAELRALLAEEKARACVGVRSDACARARSLPLQLR